MGNPALEFQRMTFQYQSNQESDVPTIFREINFQVNEGEFVSIIGTSGSGKSTLFRLITGLEQPTEGNILLNGRVAKDRLGQVGYMPQQDLLMPWRSILDNAVLPLEMKGVKKEEAQIRVLKLLDDFGLKEVEHAFPSELSGGMRQRVSFLRTILGGAEILLLDEPFGALDAITRRTMQDWLLEQWIKWRKTILFITHDVDEALFLSDRILVLIGKPVSVLKEVKIPLGRPRQLRDFTQAEMVRLKEELLAELGAKR